MSGFERKKDITERTEQLGKADKIAREILALARNSVTVNMRFLDLAVSKLGLVNGSSIGVDLATDAFDIVYTPEFILKRYKEEKELPVRDYLHVLFHCIFSHLYISDAVNYYVWDLATDIAVEAAINDLHIRAADASRALRQKSIIENLKKETDILSAEKIYRYYMDRHLEDDVILELRSLFEADSHIFWYSEEPQDRDGNRKNETQQKEWLNISKKIQTDLETFSKKQGDSAGTLMQNLAAVNRKKYNYEDFLRQFSTYGESLKINDEEFDFIYYTLGLNRYGNMPLIEPLEYAEVKKVRDFVIAIDTSASVSGDTVKKFLEKTYSILSDASSFFSRVNIHILQCDTVIQEDIKIEEVHDFEKFLDGMTVKGFGGTDFRPVFEYVDKMIQNKELTDLKGIIYFTDGYGTFPEKKPPYETAFVFVDDNCVNPDVPKWAIKLVLQTEEIQNI